MTASGMGYRDGLVDLDAGQISREIFVNEEIYAQEQERLFARAWLFVGHRKPDLRTPAISLSPAWARNRSFCAATGRARSTFS